MSQTSNTTIFAARKIITMNPMQPHATHVAVRDGRVLAVGALADMQGWGPFTLDERFAGKVLMPGLVEGHCHLKEGSMWDWTYLGWFDRRDPEGKVWSGLRSMDEVVSRLSDVAARMTAEGIPDTEPLVAWGFDPIYFGAGGVRRAGVGARHRHSRADPEPAGTAAARAGPDLPLHLA